MLRNNGQKNQSDKNYHKKNPHNPQNQKYKNIFILILIGFLDIQWFPNILYGMYNNKKYRSQHKSPVHLFIGDLMRPLNSGIVGQHTDKIIQCRWRPVVSNVGAAAPLAFVSTSADKTARFWQQSLWLTDYANLYSIEKCFAL